MKAKIVENTHGTYPIKAERKHLRFAKGDVKYLVKAIGEEVELTKVGAKRNMIMVALTTNERKRLKRK